MHHEPTKPELRPAESTTRVEPLRQLPLRPMAPALRTSVKAGLIICRARP